MLTKDECKRAFDKMVDTSYSRCHTKSGRTVKPYYFDINKPIYKGDYKALKVIDRLINVHFDPQPYTFGYLKPGM